MENIENSNEKEMAVVETAEATVVVDNEVKVESGFTSTDAIDKLIASFDIEGTLKLRQQEQEANIPIIKTTEIKTIEVAYGEGSNLRVRGVFLNGSFYACAKTFLAWLFVGNSIYAHKEAIEKNGIDAKDENGGTYVALSKINDRLLTFAFQKGTYDKEPSKYDGFVRFMSGGGMNELAVKLSIQDRFAVRDLASLGIVVEAKEEPKSTEIEGIKSDVIQLGEKLDNAIVENSKTAESLMSALESVQQNSTQNFAAIEGKFTELSKLNNQLFNGIDTLRGELKSAKSEYETAKAEIVSAKAAQSDIDPLREKLTSNAVWFRIAILVTLVFLPFSFLGLHKYIAIETPNFAAQLGVAILCVAIAVVWDGAILLFALNGKHNLVKFGSLVQFVFFSAKFDFIAMIGSDAGLDGYYWQKMLVILCAVTYSPILLNQVAQLATRNKNDTEEK